MTSKHGLVLKAGAGGRSSTPVVQITDDASRLAEIERLVHATIPLIQWRTTYEIIQADRREWIADLDNLAHPDYDARRERVAALDAAIAEVEETIRKNSKAVRVQAIRLSQGIRDRLLDDYGLDYSQTTGDSVDDLRVQWSQVVERVGGECPF